CPHLAGKVHRPTGCRQCESSEHRLCHGQRHGHSWQRLRADYGDLDLCSGRDNETVAVPVLDDLVGEPTENFQLNLSNAVNATSADSQGIGTVLDSETKFYVVDGMVNNTVGIPGSPLTYEYGSGGSSEEI